MTRWAYRRHLEKLFIQALVVAYWRQRQVGLCGLRPAQSIELVPAQSRLLHSETLSR